MRKNFGAKEWLYPEPVLIIGTYNEDGSADAMNAAWGGIGDDRQVKICLSPTHKTVKNLLRTKAFTVSPGTVESVVSCDYVGIVSGNKESEKIAKSHFSVEKSENVDAPLFKELPYSLECRLISYDEKSSCCTGEIVNVCADASILDENGNVDVRKLNPIIYDPCNHDYLSFGEKVGKAFSDGKKLM